MKQKQVFPLEMLLLPFLFLFLYLTPFTSAQMYVHLSPELLALAKNATAQYASLTRSIMSFPDANSSIGIQSTYSYSTQINPTCDPPYLATLFAPYNTCFKNYVGNQPNCSVIENCLLDHGETFITYTNCLTPTEFLYTNVAPYNDTGYLVRLFVDDVCTVPFSFFESLVVPFGCIYTDIQDASGNLCGISQNLAPSNNTIPPPNNLPLLAVVLSIQVAVIVGSVAAVGMAALYYNMHSPMDNKLKF